MFKKRFLFFIIFFIIPLSSVDSEEYSPQLGDVVINEVLSIPPSDNVEKIELYNPRDFDIDLSNFTIQDGTYKPVNLKGILNSNSYLVLEKSKDFTFSMNNLGDTLIIKYNDILIDLLTYGNFNDGNLSDNFKAPLENEVLIKMGEKYEISCMQTFGQENVFNKVNIKPISSFALSKTTFNIGEQINFDASDSYDEDGLTLIYKWDFGDGHTSESIKNTYAYTNSGYYNVKLLVCDDLNLCSEKIIKINIIEDVELKILEKIIYSDDIIITEIFPNPTMDPNLEFIEIFNKGNSFVDLNFWQLKDSSKRIFKIKNKIINPGEYLSFYKLDTRISLNDSSKESISLLSPDGEIKTKVEYKTPVEENSSYVFDYLNNEWVWTQKITPNASNIIELKNHEPTIDCEISKDGYIGVALLINCSDSYDQDGDVLQFSYDVGDGKQLNGLEKFYFIFFEKGEKKIKVSLNDGRGFVVEKVFSLDIKDNIKNTEFYIGNIKNDKDRIEIKNSAEEDVRVVESSFNIDINEIQTIENGEEICTNGTVILPPKIFSSNYFYINGSSIYSSKKDFPNLNIGDYINICGEVSLYYGEKRIKISSKDDIKIISSEKNIESYNILEDDISSNIAKLVNLTGEIIKKQGDNIFLDVDGLEVQVYLKPGIEFNKKNIKVGNNFNIIGILNKKNDIYRVLPRFIEDIKIQEKEVVDSNFEIAGLNEEKEIEKKLNEAKVNVLEEDLEVNKLDVPTDATKLNYKFSGFKTEEFRILKIIFCFILFLFGILLIIVLNQRFLILKKMCLFLKYLKHKFD